MNQVQKARIGQLDALRAIAVTAVVFSHSIAQDTEIGSYAVYLFFVLSGYLITGQLLALKAGVKPAKFSPGAVGGFYLRRAFRLFPAYYLALMVAAVLNVDGMRQELPWHLVHASNLLFALKPEFGASSWAGHFWSLSVEEQFYLLWPLGIFLLPVRWLGAAFAAVVLAGAYAWAPDNRIPDVVMRLGFIESLDSLGVGALLALAQWRGLRLSWLLPLGWAAAALSGLLLVFQLLHPTLWPTTVNLALHEFMIFAFMALISHAVAGIRGPGGAILNVPALQYIGRISYGIYLFHPFINAVYWKASEKLGLAHFDYGLGLFAVVYIASVIAAGMSWEGLEKPILRLQRKLALRPAALGAAA